MDAEPEYDVVVALTYYAPYVSGVTEAARVLAEGLVERGWRVAVVCGHHDPATPARETLHGVDVHRTPVAVRLGKGLVSPRFVPTVRRLARRARLVHQHLPMLEAGLVARAVPPGVPLVSTYHCDVDLPTGALNRLQSVVLDRSHAAALRRSRAVVVTSRDYAGASRMAEHLLPAAVEIPPPCRVRERGRPTYRDGEGQHVGFLGRIVEEKGLEHLVEGFRGLDPEARLLIAGDFDRVAGGSVVDRVRAAIGDDPRVQLLGFVPDEELADFYASLDVLALPSINSFEAFGIVQAEAMMLGVPVIASDRPGVRVPVQRTGFGTLVPPRDGAAIETALRRLEHPAHAEEAAETARELFSAESVIERHDELFRELVGR